MDDPAGLRRGAMLLLAAVVCSGCLGAGTRDGDLERRVEALERQVQALQAEKAELSSAHHSLLGSHARFVNRSVAEDAAMLELVAAVSDLKDEHDRAGLNRSTALEHFLGELHPGHAEEASPADLAMAQRVAGEARPSVVRVRVTVPGGTVASGTGWAWGPDHVVTAAHVVSRGSLRLGVLTLDGRSLEARVANVSDEQDLALLVVPGHGLPVLPAGNSTGIEAGMPVVAIGHPQGYAPWGVSLGHVDEVKTDAQAPRFYSTAPIASGNSGGPLLNEEGQAIGMTIGGKWPSGDPGPAVTGAPIHIHVAPLAVGAEQALHVPIDAIAGLVASWQASVR